MVRRSTSEQIIKAGDHEGLDVIYSPAGSLIVGVGEKILKSVANWDMDVMSPWRRVMPKTIFAGFHGKASSKLYVTSERIVLVRDIDEWRELAGELTPLGLPTAAAKEQRLKALKGLGVRQFCEVLTCRLVLSSRRRYTKRGSMLDLKLIGDDGRQYAIMIWKTDGSDPETLDLIESRFRGGDSKK